MLKLPKFNRSLAKILKKILKCILDFLKENILRSVWGTCWFQFEVFGAQRQPLAILGKLGRGFGKTQINSQAIYKEYAALLYQQRKLFSIDIYQEEIRIRGACCSSCFNVGLEQGWFSSLVFLLVLMWNYNSTGSPCVVLLVLMWN